MLAEFFDDEAFRELRLRRLIFHVIDPNPKVGVELFDEVDPAGFEKFFLELIRAAGRGATFEFLDAAGVKDDLQSIASESDFVDVSKKLASSFAEKHVLSSVRGAFVMAQIEGQGKSYFSIIKYDNLDVIQFDRDISSGGKRTATLASVEDAFVQDEKALQKAALITGCEAKNTVYIIDRQNRGVAQFFKNWLGVAQRHDDKAIAKGVKVAVQKLVDRFSDAIGDSGVKSWQTNLHQFAAAGKKIDLADADAFLGKVLGPNVNEQMTSTFEQELRKKDMLNEAFTPTRAEFRKPSLKRIKSAEDVTVFYPPEAQAKGQVIVESIDGNRKRITLELTDVRETEVDEVSEKRTAARRRASETGRVA